jgi:hypothetical protein
MGFRFENLSIAILPGITAARNSAIAPDANG